MRQAVRFAQLLLALSLPVWGLGWLYPGPVGGLPLPISAVMAVLPATAAVILLAREAGGLGTAVGRVLGWLRAGGLRRPWWRPVVLLGTMPAAVVLAAVVAGGRAGLPVLGPWLVLAAVMLVLSTVAEQIGWTGYLRPPLHARFGELTSALLIGAFWGAWHVVPNLQYGHPAGWIVGQVVFSTALRVVIQYLAGASVPAAAAVQFSYDLAWIATPPEHYDPVLTAGVTAAVAVALVLGRRRGR